MANIFLYNDFVKSDAYDILKRKISKKRKPKNKEEEITWRQTIAKELGEDEVNYTNYLGKETNNIQH